MEQVYKQRSGEATSSSELYIRLYCISLQQLFMVVWEDKNKKA